MIPSKIGDIGVPAHLWEMVTDPRQFGRGSVLVSCDLSVDPSVDVAFSPS